MGSQPILAQGPAFPECLFRLLTVQKQTNIQKVTLAVILSFNEDFFAILKKGQPFNQKPSI